MTSRPRTRPGLDPLLADILFIAGYVLLYLVALAVLRGILILVNPELAAAVPAVDLGRSFLVGLRFDLIIACILAAPLVLALLFPQGLGRRRLALLWLAISAAVTLFVAVAELEFYREFHTRLNSIALHYLEEDPATVSSMIWYGFPVVRYLLLWLAIWLLYMAALRWLSRLTPKRPVTGYRFAWRLPVFVLVTFLVFWGGRGTLRSGPPLRWGDAFHSQHLFANHLALNGTYTLAKAIMDTQKDQGTGWLTALPPARALALVRGMLLTPQDELLDAADYAVLRRHTPVNRLPRPPRNIVVIIMESFSGEFTGALGHDQGITPEFDRLATQGLLFDRFFSNGTHTHQGMFATLACFPNLPGYEYLMQQPEGQHAFSGLPILLNQQGFNNIYLYNGHFAWDNQQGFFRNQGMSGFIGRDDYRDPVFIDPTWGVSDQDMFARAADELDQMPAERPFYAVLQTLSNHTPYALPADLPVDAVTGHGKLDQHLTAQRYSDWALGEFFRRVEHSPWYRDTLFVILGDHGFAVSRSLSDIDLLRFRVPLLLLGPGIRETYGAVNHTVATQTDVVPTVVGLLGKPFVHQCWGRNLLSLPAGDPGIGVIKPSGSDITVAILRGDELLVKPPQGEAIPGRYTLYPDETYRRRKHMTSGQDLSERLSAYIQSAMHSLRENRTGIPPGNAAQTSP